MRKLLFVLAGCALLGFPGGQGHPQDAATAPGVHDSEYVVPDTLRSLANAAFKEGEYLRFDVHFGFVTAGEAVMTVTDTVVHGHRKAYRIDFVIESKPFFDFFYKVRDRYQTVIDSAGLFPWRFEQHIREGNFSRDFVAEFDQVNHRAKTTGGLFPTVPYVHDIMSAFYFSRTVDYTKFRPGQRIHLQNFYKDSTYTLDVKYKGRQQIEVDAGKFNCIIIEPLAQEGGLFKNDGKIFIWITDDDRKMPVKVSTQVPIGSIDSELTEYRGLNGPLHAKVDD
jgi:hypothetical protein